jgi:hypothetical protein
MRILAIDPGETTGLAAIDLDTFGWPITTWTLGPATHHDRLFKILGGYNAVVCESFDNRGNIAALLVSVEYIGVVKLASDLHLTEAIFQTPSEGKTFWDDRKLRKLGLWKPTTHERDAVRHLLYFLTFEGQNMHWINQLKA